MLLSPRAGLASGAGLAPLANVLGARTGERTASSVVELRDDLRQLEHVLALLDPSWDAVFSDALADPGGNHERIGFVFNRRVVSFTGLASDAEPPRKKAASGEYLPVFAWWRPPYMASFRSGRFDFVLLAAHVRWAGQREVGRLGEMKLLADWVAKRAREKLTDDKDLLVVGDFNIPSTTGPMWKAITDEGSADAGGAGGRARIGSGGGEAVRPDLAPAGEREGVHESGRGAGFLSGGRGGGVSGEEAEQAGVHVPGVGPSAALGAGEDGAVSHRRDRRSWSVAVSGSRARRGGRSPRAGVYAVAAEVR